ncbi:MAG TPA: hypothetical protein VMT34_05220, partial [Aggregatilineales bacterium]|nr:hypothetical protein [Aggregatilineales bacterium]
DTDRNGDGYLDDQGEMKKQHIRWGLGYDISLWGVDWSPAITQWIVLGYDPALIQPQYDTSISLFARKPLPEYAAVFQVLAIGLINMKELYLKPKYIFNVTDRFQIAAGLDLFFGSKSQLGISGGSTALTGTNAINQDPHFFGNFTGNDRIFAEFKYTF